MKSEGSDANGMVGRGAHRRDSRIVSRYANMGSAQNRGLLTRRNRDAFSCEKSRENVNDVL